jgi:hypothetical protein
MTETTQLEPQARIKKIMQKDEEVGKVAQATPIVICTCLLVFYLFSFFSLVISDLLYFFQTFFEKRNVKLTCLFVVCYHKAKALELFLALVIEKSSAITSERGSKRVEVYHLYVPQLPSHFPTSVKTLFALTLPLTHRKHAVENTETLDFLKELVQDVPDPSAGGTIDLEAEASEAKKKRKGKRSTTVTTTSVTSDPNAPTTTKKRRRKRANTEAKAATVATDEGFSGGGGSGSLGTEGEEDPTSAVRARRRMFDEDTEMQDDMDEYDEDESMRPPPPPPRPPPPTGSSTASMSMSTSVSFRRSSPDDDEDDD